MRVGRAPGEEAQVDFGYAGKMVTKQSFVDRANREVREWCLETAGQRTHGATQEQPLRRFEEIERAQLKPLPPVPYDRGEWKLLKLHRDCHVVFEKAYYSVPVTHIGQQVRVRGGNRQVRIYSQDYELLATHDHLERPGERSTHPDHLPPEKLPDWLLDREACREEAAAIGPSTAQVVDTLLGDPVVDRLAGVDMPGGTQVAFTYNADGQLIAQTRDSVPTYYLSDGQGSIRALTIASGVITDTYDYTAFGELVAQTGSPTTAISTPGSSSMS
ncbi:MAG: hypothetical protein JXB07_06850 [Anaerolineae bacterium]|nr:hypothetical protein [Anaerolineae bacterium]